MKIELYDIKWDTDGEEVELPESVIVEIDSSDLDSIQDDGADLLSDNFGFCVNSFRIKKI